MSEKSAAEQLVNALVRREISLNEMEIRQILAKMHTCDTNRVCVACSAFEYLNALRFPSSKSA